MSKAFDNFDFTPEPEAPFWRPFLFALLFAFPASALCFYMVIYQGMRMPLFTLAVGLMCGWGARIGYGDYYPAFLGTLIHITATTLLIALVLLAAELELSLGETFWRIVLQGQVTGFFNSCALLFSSRSFAAIPLAFYVAYKVQNRD